ncbi:Hpt domain-containing protein [Arenimonas sp.]|uniref:Hpt domain-containing protein n=1 Tax=Arenimonas sp. TaxID=1872635 RepID=UPI0035B130DE
MPGIDGYELTRRIRDGEGHGHHTAIVALTANALQGEAERCLAAGMDGYLAKPLVIDDLRQALERWLPAPEEGSGATVTLATGLSLNVLRGFVGDEPGAAFDFLGRFHDNAARTHARIEAAWQAQDAVAVGEQAHSLKTSARMVGAQALARLCEQLEDAGPRGDAQAVEALMPRYRDELARVLAHATQLLSQRG